MDIGKIPPHDIEAEQAILGSMLTDKDAVISAIEILKEDAFYREDNKAIYAAIVSLYSKNEPIDIITVKNELTEAGNFDRVGGIEYLASLPDRVPTTANVEKYVKIVKEKYMLRSLIQSANTLISLGYSETEDINVILDRAEKEIFELSQNGDSTGFTAIKQVLVETITEIEKLYNQKGGITGVSTGFIDLDRKTSGLHGSELIILAARPAMGKSAFAINIATNAALKAKVPVAIFNLEMSKAQVGNRILCSQALIDNNKIKTGQLEDQDWGKLNSAISILSEAPIYIDDNPDLTVNEIRTKCRKLKMEKNIGLVVIDYLQLIKGSGKKTDNREQEVANNSRSLKILAKELNIPVIALAQLSRGVDSRQDKKPMLSDLRESGSIEQDADIVMFLHREDYYNKEVDVGNKAELILAKHRSGSTGSIPLAWMPNYTRFDNLEQRFDD